MSDSKFETKSTKSTISYTNSLSSNPNKSFDYDYEEIKIQKRIKNLLNSIKEFNKDFKIVAKSRSISEFFEYYEDKYFDSEDSEENSSESENEFPSAVNNRKGTNSDQDKEEIKSKNDNSKNDESKKNQKQTHYFDKDLLYWSEFKKLDKKIGWSKLIKDEEIFFRRLFNEEKKIYMEEFYKIFVIKNTENFTLSENFHFLRRKYLNVIKRAKEIYGNLIKMEYVKKLINAVNRLE